MGKARKKPKEQREGKNEHFVTYLLPLKTTMPHRQASAGKIYSQLKRPKVNYGGVKKYYIIKYA